MTPSLPATEAANDQTEIHYQYVAEDVTQSYVRTTATFNLTGQPALSVPCGFDTDSLPIGLQIAGRPFEDAVVLRIGAAFEEAVSDKWPSPPVHASSLSAATGDT